MSRISIMAPVQKVVFGPSHLLQLRITEAAKNRLGSDAEQIMGNATPFMLILADELTLLAGDPGHAPLQALDPQRLHTYLQEPDSVGSLLSSSFTVSS